MKGTTAIEWAVAGIIFFTALFTSYFLIVNNPQEVKDNIYAYHYNLSMQYNTLGCYEWGLAKTSMCFNSSGCVKVGDWLLAKANTSCLPCHFTYAMQPTDLVSSSGYVNNTNISIAYTTTSFDFSYNNVKYLEEGCVLGNFTGSNILQNESFLLNYTQHIILLPSYASMLLLVSFNTTTLTFNLTNDYATWDTESQSGDFYGSGILLNTNTSYLCVSSTSKTLCFSSYATYNLYNQSGDFYLDVVLLTQKLYISFTKPKCLRDITLRYGAIVEG